MLDLTLVKSDRMRSRVGMLSGAAHGASIELFVKNLAVDPAVADLLRRYAVDRRLSIRVLGEPWAVERWVHALTTGDDAGMLL